MSTSKRSRRNAAGDRSASGHAARTLGYRRLRHPFEPQRIFSDDEIEHIHETSLRVLEELGMRILLPEARTILRRAGARCDEETQTVRLGRDMIESALTTAPRSIRLRAASSEREQQYELGALLFSAAGGCPNATDLDRGRRPGSLRDFEETIRLQQSFDVIHLLSPSVEPQDIPVHLRHYAMMRAQLTLADKPMFIFARGQAQVVESFEMIRVALDLDDAEFTNGVWANTIINTNSPRQIDIPMARGIIDFARAGQMSVISPFCLAGAMAPITISGALALQHAEALAGITLAQVTRPGAPVSNGGFSSNVNMKSGSPAFGTPEHIKLTIGSGQLARRIGLPWRWGSGAASNTADAQGANETGMGLWASLLGGASMLLHCAGWLEGGLSFGYEKFINDVEALQTIAELCRPTPATADDIGFHAMADVQPGGHFFETAHTMSRYRDAFYEPLVADLSNFGAWTDSGALTATERAKSVWKSTLDGFTTPRQAGAATERLSGYIDAHSARGGAQPEQ